MKIPRRAAQPLPNSETPAWRRVYPNIICFVRTTDKLRSYYQIFEEQLSRGFIEVVGDAFCDCTNRNQKFILFCIKLI